MFCCCNKLLQTEWLKTAHLFSYTSGSRKSHWAKISRAAAGSFLEALVENPLSCFSRLLETVHVPQRMVPVPQLQSQHLHFCDHSSIVLSTYADVSSTEKIQATVTVELLTNHSAHQLSTKHSTHIYRCLLHTQTRSPDTTVSHPGAGEKMSSWGRSLMKASERGGHIRWLLKETPVIQRYSWDKVGKAFLAKHRGVDQHDVF